MGSAVSHRIMSLGHAVDIRFPDLLMHWFVTYIFILKTNHILLHLSYSYPPIVAIYQGCCGKHLNMVHLKYTITSSAI